MFFELFNGIFEKTKEKRDREPHSPKPCSDRLRSSSNMQKVLRSRQVGGVLEREIAWGEDGAERGRTGEKNTMECELPI